MQLLPLALGQIPDDATVHTLDRLVRVPQRRPAGGREVNRVRTPVPHFPPGLDETRASRASIVETRLAPSIRSGCR
jgi:hypothetical protein